MECMTRSGPVLSRDLCNLFPSILLTSIIFHPLLLSETNERIHNYDLSWGQLPPLVGARVQDTRRPRGEWAC